MRRNLIVVRAGDDSLHPTWLAGAEDRNFDILVSYFGTDPGDRARDADYFEAVPGMKWPRLHQLWEERREWLSRYEACWLADDDLATDAANLCRMFELFHARALWLAQPALGPGSHVSHGITRQVAGSMLRFTSFVEVMCPLFSNGALERLAHTFRESVSGWGLDYLWPHLLGYPRDRIAILDATPVVHARRQGVGANYARCAELRVSPYAEAEHIKKRHGIGAPPFETYASC